jgi:hypothetical protein
MKPLNAKQLCNATNDEVLNFLREVLESRIVVRPADSRFMSQVEALPVGLRAMATTHHLDISLTHDDLGWHFGNWHDKQLGEATLVGLQILCAFELADIFRESFEVAKKYWSELGAPNWPDWYANSTLEVELEPLNDRAWEILKGKWNGILGYWVEYARTHPIEVGAVNES